MSATPASETVDTIAALATEGRNPASAGLDQLDAAGIARLMSSQDAAIAGQVAEQIPAIARLMECMVERLRRGGRVFFTGAGTSGRLGVLDAAECVPT
ncbi:MAG: N-acetylmuramic acid 6-phosphate etherase, partial [Gemmataceae bacterium]